MSSPDRPGAADTYRAELAGEPHGERGKAARAALEQAEADKARREHSILGYRRFLSEFPSGPLVAEMRARLEALRFAEAEKAGTEAALRGFLADEPAGAHANEAWEKLAGLELEAAIASGGEDRLRAWLQGHPQAARRTRALAALDEAQFLAAREAGPEQAAALRRYLAERGQGRHRVEAQALLVQREVDDAVVMEDDARLSALARQGAGGAVARAAERLELARAAARLDREALAGLASRGGTTAGEAKALLDKLSDGEADELVRAAGELYLPLPSADELPAGAAERAAALGAWEVALDGRRLAAVLAEVRSPRAWVSLAALRAAGGLLEGLPQAERRARAAALVENLRPKAQSAALLVELSLLEEAAGRPEEALAQARAAVGRERLLVAAMHAAQLEARLGEPAVALLAAQALAAQAGAVAELHREAAKGTADRRPDPIALLEVCAAYVASQEASRLVESRPIAFQDQSGDALARAGNVAIAIASLLDEAEYAVVDPHWVHCLERRAQVEKGAEAAIARRVEAAKKLATAEAGAAALDRARHRDPAIDVQAVIVGARSRAAAAPLR